MKLGLCLLAIALVTTSCGRIGGPPPPVRQVEGKTVVNDAAGATLVIDENGCQTVIPADGGTPELVRDVNGAPVCVPVLPQP
ncbi:hypothetical protein [Litorisediminicola beolgyonensis]|uniref:Lipoprotein n=1 Tax=Litorisediminicola beolgyonensis TaxID=1173614 RepID=A0ABW3ZM73_9RHOB